MTNSQKAILSISDHDRAKFFEQVEIKGPNDCWEGFGTKNAQGYMIFRVNGSNCLAHRLSYFIHHGTLPENLLVCHKCDNPPCVNPNHLFLGTRGDNARDCSSKGRFPTQARTHCPQGHEYSEENTYINKLGHRVCRAFRRVSILKILS